MPVDGRVVVSFERMNRILRIDTDNRVAVIEPGVPNGDLQKALAPHGFLAAGSEFSVVVHDWWQPGLQFGGATRGEVRQPA